MTTEELMRLLKAKADEEMVDAEYPPVSAAEFAACEKKMKVKLPELLKFIYTEIANGGIGPGEMLLGLGDEGMVSDSNDKDLVSYYRGLMKTEVHEDFDDASKDWKWEWIDGLVPIVDWGYAQFTIMDCNTPDFRTMFCDLEEDRVDYKKAYAERDTKYFGFPGVPFAEWVASWLDDEAQRQFVYGGEPKPKQPAPAAEPKSRPADQGESETDYWYGLRKAAEAGDAEGQYKYAGILFQNNSDKSLSNVWYEKAAQQGHPDACHRQAASFRDGWGNQEIDWDRAYEYNKKASDPLEFYSGAKGVSWTDHSEGWWNAATKWWHKRVGEGDGRAAFCLAFAYENGHAHGTLEKAFDAYLRAAELGYDRAQSKVGEIYSQGWNHVAVDEKKAVHWLSKAADNGDTRAQFYLWNHFSSGDRDWKLAVKYLEQAAKERSIKEVMDESKQAAIALAQLHIAGQHVKRDVTKAVKLLERAAKWYDPAAIYHLGTLHKNGALVPQNFDEAVKWFKFGIEKVGDPNCFYELAMCHENGNGVGLDTARAIQLYELADRKGHKQAKDRLEALRAKSASS